MYELELFFAKSRQARFTEIIKPVSSRMAMQADSASTVALTKSEALRFFLDTFLCQSLKRLKRTPTTMNIRIETKCIGDSSSKELMGGIKYHQTITAEIPVEISPIIRPPNQELKKTAGKKKNHA
jgi:hypothetical protein